VDRVADDVIESLKPFREVGLDGIILPATPAVRLRDDPTPGDRVRLRWRAERPASQTRGARIGLRESAHRQVEGRRADFGAG
jgi:hypothetical protein